MVIVVGQQISAEIDDRTFVSLLNIYPEETLMERKVFRIAREKGYIRLSQLKEECEKILIPWQFFLVEHADLESILEHIENERVDKVSSKLLSKRQGAGNTTSRRIIDRLIRCQNFIISDQDLPNNDFCGSLKGMTIVDCVKHIRDVFDIQSSRLRSLSKKSDALDYLVGKVEDKNINVSLGVLDNNKILPTIDTAKNVYKNTSGFIIHDKKIPFIFIPSAANPDEPSARQIYTIIYLLVLIGLDAPQYYIEKDFKIAALSVGSEESLAHDVTGELLLPSSEFNELQSEDISKQYIADLSSTYKITPTAAIVILRKRGVISYSQYTSLLEDFARITQSSVKSSGLRKTPLISTSSRKFNGKYVIEKINDRIRDKSLNRIQAQYLLFGRVNKKNFRRYREFFEL